MATIYSNSLAITKAAKDGYGISVDIVSSNGNVFRPSNIKTTLSCRVLKNNEDITEQLDAWRFNWVRNTGNESADTYWNNLSKARGTKTIDITQDDCKGRTVFDCFVEIDNI